MTSFTESVDRKLRHVFQIDDNDISDECHNKPQVYDGANEIATAVVNLVTVLTCNKSIFSVSITEPGHRKLRHIFQIDRNDVPDKCHNKPHVYDGVNEVAAAVVNLITVLTCKSRYLDVVLSNQLVESCGTSPNLKVNTIP